MMIIIKNFRKNQLLGVKLEPQEKIGEFIIEIQEMHIYHLMMFLVIKLQRNQLKL